MGLTIAELKSRNLLLFTCISGSKAYGLDTANSDTDIRGVFVLPQHAYYGLHYVGSSAMSATTRCITSSSVSWSC
jgi:uncharacterized protein